MLAHAYRLDPFHPHGHAIILLCLVALTAIFFLVRGVLSQSRRNVNPRANPANPTHTLPRSNLPGLCQRCRSPLSVEAAYCGRCGLPVSRPAPIPLPQQRGSPGVSRGLIYAVIILLGLVGYFAFEMVSDSAPSPPPPTPQHAPGDAW